MRKIQFYNASILTNAGDILAEKDKGYLQSSVNAANRLSGLIDDLLKYSETALTSGEFEEVNLTNVISEIVEFYKDLPDLGEIKSYLNEAIIVTGISFQLRQLFENLIGNAIKYRSPKRKLSIKILCTKVTSNKSSSSEEANTYFHKISIEDNGIGFEPEFAGKIFELFVRLQGRQDYSGNGVGLAICKRIIQNHRGMIRVNSIPGQGSVFHVFFPFR